MSEKIVVIGSNSFSGAHFIDRALSEGASVVGISRSVEPIAAFLPHKSNPNFSRYQFLQLDLNHDLEPIMSVMADVQPEYVVNFASQSMVAESWLHPEHWFQTNAVAQVRLHDRLRRLPFLQKYVHVSTPEVYGSCRGAVQEDAPLNPSTPYAVSRAAADMSLQSFVKHYRFPAVFTRAANVFGPGQQLYRIVPRAILFAKLGRKLQLHGGGQSKRSFIHIDDVSRGTLAVMRGARSGEIYHLSTERQISIRDLVAMIAQRMNIAFEELVEIVGERPGKDDVYWLDSSKIQSSFGWRPEISLEQGIQHTIDWIESNLAELRSQPLDYIHKT